MTGQPADARPDTGAGAAASGDIPCPNDGELVNVQCWRCGWLRDFDARLEAARAAGHWPDGVPFDQCRNPIPTPNATGPDRQNCGRCRYRVRYVGPDVHHMRWEHTEETYR